MSFPWSRTYRVKCPDGSTRTVHRNIDEAFPLDVRSSQTRLAAGIAGVSGVASGNISSEHQDKVESLLVAIDSKNNTLMVKFRAAYLVFMTNPCRQSEYLADQIRQLIEMHDRLTEVELGTQSLIALIASKPTDTHSILTLFRELVNKLQPAAPKLNSEAAKFAIGDAIADARKWIQPGESIDKESE